MTVELMHKQHILDEINTLNANVDSAKKSHPLSLFSPSPLIPGVSVSLL